MKSKVMWPGSESPDWRSIGDGLFFPDMLCVAYEDKMRSMYDIWDEWPGPESHPSQNIFLSDPIISEWSNVIGELRRCSDILGDLICSIKFPQGHPSHRPYYPSDEAFIRARTALSLFFDLVLKRLDGAQEPLRRLDRAVLALERGQAITGTMNSIISKSNAHE